MKTFSKWVRDLSLLDFYHFLLPLVRRDANAALMFDKMWYFVPAKSSMIHQVKNRDGSRMDSMHYGGLRV